MLQVDDDDRSRESGICLIEYCDHGCHKSCTSEVKFYVTKSGDRVLRDAKDDAESIICNSWWFAWEPRAESQIDINPHVHGNSSENSTGAMTQPVKKHWTGDQFEADSVLVPSFLVNKWKRLEEIVCSLRQDLVLMMTKPATETLLLFFRNELLHAIDQDFGFLRTVVNCK